MALTFGSDLLVRKSKFLADRFNISSIYVGALILGVGTSLPEWAVSALSSFKGLPNLAVGNVIGSNIFNICVVLSLVLLTPNFKWPRLATKDLLFLSVTSFLLLPVLKDHFLSRAEGLFLLSILVVYGVLSFGGWKLWQAVPKGDKAVEDEPAQKVEEAQKVTLQPALRVVWGFLLLVGGSYVSVLAARNLGFSLGFSERVVGILVVSVGTSLPEFFTSVVAIIKGYKNLAIGNIIGSNLFNSYAVLGTSSLILPSVIDSQVAYYDLPFLLRVYVVLQTLVFSFLFCKSIRKYVAWSLAIFLFGFYVFYIYFLFF